MQVFSKSLIVWRTIVEGNARNTQVPSIGCYGLYSPNVFLRRLLIVDTGENLFIEFILLLHLARLYAAAIYKSLTYLRFITASRRMHLRPLQCNDIIIFYSCISALFLLPLGIARDLLWNFGNVVFFRSLFFSPSAYACIFIRVTCSLQKRIYVK